MPYIGAKAVQDAGVTGKGIKVAVLDSGIDYTHAALGGSGQRRPTAAANNPDDHRAGTFPTRRSIGGYDFIGSEWIGGTDRRPRLPIPTRSTTGRVAVTARTSAHIIGGKGGVAPARRPLRREGVLVRRRRPARASRSSRAWSGRVDPNGDGNFNDRMHLINMSLGSTYGQPFDDDLSLAVENATKAGILTVASAGNSSDKPYIIGTPSATDSALSVAQTAVPSAFLPLMQIVAPASIVGNFPAVFQPWSAPLDGGDPGAGAVRERRGWEPRRVRARSRPGSLAGQDRPRRSRHLQLHAEDRQHRATAAA